MTRQQRKAFSDAKRQAKEMGYSLSYDDEADEYRAAPLSGSEASKERRAYYTPDLEDALGTIRFETSRRI